MTIWNVAQREIYRANLDAIHKLQSLGYTGLSKHASQQFGIVEDPEALTLVRRRAGGLDIFKITHTQGPDYMGRRFPHTSMEAQPEGGES